MNSLKQRSGVRVIFALVTSALCFSLVSMTSRKGASKGLLNKKPSVAFQASTTSITYPCPPDFQSFSRSCPVTADFQVALTAIAEDFNKQPVYTYTVAAGRVVGAGAKVAWDLSDVGPGIYTAAVEVHDKEKHRALSSVTVTITNCGDCVDRWACPTMVVACYDQVKAGTPITCKVVMGPLVDSATYKWSVRTSIGEDISERIINRGTSISITTNGLAGQTVYARVEVKGLDPSCAATASGSTVVKP